VASIARDPNGRKRILFVATDSKRKTIRLGKVSQRAAEAVKVRIEDLVTSAITGHSPADETARWIADIPNDLADKLARVGLIPPRQRITLGPFIAEYIEKRQDVKPASKTVWHQGERSLVEYFGADRPAGQVTPAEAEDYKQALI